MQSSGHLLFGDLPAFPELWMLGLLAFVALWWYICGSWPAIRRTFLALWLPSAMLANAIHALDGRGYAVTHSLRLFGRRDPAVFGLMHWIPSDGFRATYAIIIGGAAAAFASIGLLVLGVLLGAMLAIVAPGLNQPRRRRPQRQSGKPAGTGPRH